MVYSKFQIGLNIRDLSLLFQIQQFFVGVGKIHTDPQQKFANYVVTKISDLNNVILPHFVKYPLLSKKAADFILFQRVIEIMSNNGHLSIEGIHQIINIKATMNLGLSDTLKYEFSYFTPVDRPIIVTQNIPDPNWIAGFVTGEGNFDVKISNSKTHKIGYQVFLRFRVWQHERDIKLMELLKKYLGSGKIEKNSRNSIVCLSVNKISDITNIIIPFFDINSLFGVKQFDYLD